MATYVSSSCGRTFSGQLLSMDTMLMHTACTVNAGLQWS
eukprot:CAMPEP_0175430210 /NCGR_PEP_ID=MMETSP0095-20121207/51749_1 /TAXON_ID=311494 /ORGANISM="Alexandrium monilatum, Strain CCMP3105" /LENGTH=38 /DNA_ID= /DNA_START= /DNA_END= /DNA_ORIENTATION=